MDSKVVNIQPNKREADKYQAVSWIVNGGEIIISQITETGTETVALNIEQAGFVLPGINQLLSQGPEAG